MWLIENAGHENDGPIRAKHENGGHGSVGNEIIGQERYIMKWQPGQNPGGQWFSCTLKT